VVQARLNAGFFLFQARQTIRRYLTHQIRACPPRRALA
jgi:hypothetical protein